MSTNAHHKTTQFPGIIAPYCVALEKSVGALIYRNTNQGREYLLMQYPHGHWEFPRGHVEKNETEQETMFRETEEETGLTKTDLYLKPDFRATMRFSYMARGTERQERIRERRCLLIRKTVVFYLLEATTHDIVLSDEHQNFTWLPPETALAKLTFENARRILRRAEKYLT